MRLTIPFRSAVTSRLSAAALLGLAAGCASFSDPTQETPSNWLSNGAQDRRALSTLPAKATAAEGIKQASASVFASPEGPAKSPVPPAATPGDQLPSSLSPSDAVAYALQNNPLLQAVRTQRGFAAGGIVIAQTYPFNPIAETFEQPDFGPHTAGITNHLQFQAAIRLDLELRGQMRHRRSAAAAVLSRTEWEIAVQELQVSVATARAANTVLYRNRKLDVLEDTVKLNELVAETVKKLVDAGRLRPADTIVSRTELDAARAARGQGRVAVAVAKSDLRYQLGGLDPSIELKGELDVPLPTTESELYVKAAREVRPDLHARRAAVDEAQAHLRLQIADRYGNISFGPSYELDDTSTQYIGVALFIPLPVLNTRRGEIMQAQSTVARAQADVRQIEVQSEQEVQAALIRLAEARKWADTYAREVLPHLKQATQDMEKLLAQNDPGVDVIKVLDVQRTYLKAFDSYLDALYEISQARVDLAAAVGDPALALGLYAPKPPEPKPGDGPMPLPLPNLVPAKKP